MSLIALSACRAAPAAEAPTRAGMRSFDAALQAVRRGQWGSAAARVREGLHSAPDSVLLHNLSGTMLLSSGNVTGAETEWRLAHALSPDDPTASYGRGLVALARGRMADADAWIRRASETGDAGACILAKLYMSVLRGAPVDSSVSLADDMVGARLAIEAVLAGTAGDKSRALSAARSALAMGAAGRYAEPIGILMSFERKRPLKFAAPALPTGTLPSVARTGHTRSDGRAALHADDDASFEVWRLLALRPSRAALATMGAEAAASLGDQATARQLGNLAQAIDPAKAVVSWLAENRSNGASTEPVRIGPGQRRVVALTFDDGPHPKPTRQLLTMLARHRVRATFFVVGRCAAQNPGLIAQMAQAGMEIANHSFSHPNLTRITDRKVAEELLRTSACIQDVTGAPPAYFRPPGGRMSDNVARIGAALGLRACMWTVNARHRELEGPRAVVEAVLREVVPGAVILLHNGAPATMAALPELIAGLRTRGYEFVTVTELMRSGT
ncbi:MAG: hypothetical protein FJX72_12940 [Armatimonadetes bacterium]|nr:hypothetical protein [Armatimonadota bacterium]